MTESEARPFIDVPFIDGPFIDVPFTDVIVPVHGAGAVFRRCAASVIAHAHAFGAPFRLVIVLDGPPDAESLVAVAELRAAARREVGGFELEVLEHETRLGFVLSVNHAWRGSNRDAVLLNSDTQVTAGWLGRLRAAAYSDPAIATVTPFSNNATICSLPRFLDENAIPAGYTIDSFGALVTRVSRREYPRLPTGVGFCLYVKRSVLDEIGLFDEAFGLGYGEEVDFCLRAASRGYVHVLDDATFIFHEGSRSFGRRREHRMRRGERLVLSRYPDYLRKVAEFIKSDPIASARARVVDQLRKDQLRIDQPKIDRPTIDQLRTARNTEATNGERLPAVDPRLAESGGAAAGWPQRVLHLVPGWPPWTSEEAATSARELVRDQSARREVFVYARMADPDRADGSALEYVDGGVRVRLIVANGAPRTVLSRVGVRSDPIGADFARFLEEVRPQIVHVHDQAGQWLDLLGAARARTIRAALKSVEAFVMSSQSVADRYVAARLLPRSARVAVSPLPLPMPLDGDGDTRTHEEIERVYATIMHPRDRP